MAELFIDGAEIKTPIVYTLSKTKIRIWQGIAFATNENPPTIDSPRLEPDVNNRGAIGVYYTRYGQEGGKITVSKIKIIETGKNIGKKNETTPFGQAVAEVTSLFNKRLDKGVLDLGELRPITTFEDLRSSRKHWWRIDVMTLHNVKCGNNWAKVKYPALLQPKLDGMHYVVVYSPAIENSPSGIPHIDGFLRGKKKGEAQQHIIEALAKVLPKYPEVFVSGELWSEGMVRQDIASHANQEKFENIEHRLEFHIFDTFKIGETAPFAERIKLAEEIVAAADSPYVRLVAPVEVADREGIESYFKETIKKHEGIVIRNPQGKYEMGKRSYTAMKYKPLFDDEFKIVATTDGKGKMRGQIIFVAETAEGKQFSVVPKWNEERRREAFTRRGDFVGKLAVVQYDSISKEGIPVQPVLLEIKEKL